MWYKILALYFPENKDFQLWQPITHMFMHGGFMHIFQYVCVVFFWLSIRTNLGSKKFYFSIFPVD
jgi:membrane associated rhomboid family serine protease